MEGNVKKYWIDKRAYEEAKAKTKLTAEAVKEKNPTLYKCLAPEGGKQDSIEGIAGTLGMKISEKYSKTKSAPHGLLFQIIGTTKKVPNGF
jgi:hypothetical protein